MRNFHRTMEKGNAMDDGSGGRVYGDEGQVQTLLDAIDGYSISMLDSSGRVISWNRGAEYVEGYMREEALGMAFDIFFTPEDVASGVPAEKLEQARRTGRFAGEGWRIRKGGARYWASFAVSAMWTKEGHLIGYSRVVHDLSERKGQEDALRAMEASLRDERDALYAAAESSMDAFYICKAVRGKDGTIEDFVFTFLNSNVEKMVSIPRSEMLGARVCELLPVNRTLGLFERYCRVVETGEPMAGEFPISSADVKSSWIRVQAVKLHDGVAITASDITRRKQIEAQIIHTAQHDPLTGLVNRSLLHDRIMQATDRAGRYRSRVGVFVLDLDGFKRVNDTMGHAAGDYVLMRVAERLKAVVRVTDSVIRIGGDEFVVVMPDMRDEADILCCAEKILAAVGERMEIDGIPSGITCSLGIAVFPKSGSTAEDLLLEADAAMYRAKRNGRNQIAMAEDSQSVNLCHASERAALAL